QAFEATLLLMIEPALSPLFAWLVHGLHPIGADDVGRVLRLLLIIPLYLFLRHIVGLERSWWAGLTLGALIAGCYALWHSMTGGEGQWHDRVSGPTNPIYFGGIVLAFGLMLLPRISDTSISLRQRVLVTLAVLFALLASALSGSRGAWLALPPLLLLYVLTLGSHQRPVWRFGVPLVLLLAAFLIGLLPAVPLGLRVTEGLSAVMALAQGDVPVGSLGIRWALWQISIQGAIENLVVGGGPGAFRLYLEQAVAAGQLDEFFLRYHHPHNQYVSALLIAGIPGLLSLIALLALPLFVLLHQRRRESDAIRRFGWCVLTMVLVFAVMSLTESIFQRNNGIVWFALLISLGSALLNTANDQ
ncbi:MAG: O-antigen ligase family protein, partial [Pseudomonadota bacterium]